MQITSSIDPVPLVDHLAETPLWTRHSRGAIEAGRDRRLQRRVHAPIRYLTLTAETVAVQADLAGR
jgi:hypothetical protein